jgi:hypothetical protein
LRNFRFRHFLHRLDQRGIIIGGLVHAITHRMDVEQVLARGRDQRGRRLRVGSAVIEPKIEGLRRQDGRHAIVQRRELMVGRGGHDGGGFHLLTVRAHPAFPQAGKGHRPAIAGVDVMRLLALSRPFPFVKAVERDQATAIAHRRLEGRFLQHGFAARIDQ